MLREVLSAKIHRATVTQADLDYVGSITIDADLLEACGMVANEKVLVADMTNGERLETYIIKGEAGSGVIGMNGAAAHLVNVGDEVIIMAYGLVDSDEIEDHIANVIVVGKDNKIEAEYKYPSA